MTTSDSTVPDSLHSGLFSRTRISSLLQRSAFLNKQCNSAPYPSLHLIHRKKTKNSQWHLLRKCICTKNILGFGTTSSFQLGQTGISSGQAVIKGQMKHSFSHGSCRFHECRNTIIFLTGHQELVHGAYAWVIILPREIHAVIKSPQPKTGLHAESISDKTRSSIIRSSLMKTSYYANSCEFWTCHACQERDLNTALLAGYPPSYLSLTSFKQHPTQSACPALRQAQTQLF